MGFFRSVADVLSGNKSLTNSSTDSKIGSDLQEKAFMIYQPLEMQKQLFLKREQLPELAESHQAIGFVLGWTDAGCQHLGVSEEESHKVFLVVFDLAFDDGNKATAYLKMGYDAAQKKSGKIFEGIMQGGTEFAKCMHDSDYGPPMGWYAIATGEC